MSNYRWNIYKSRVTSRWVVWHKPFAPMKFDTWQEAMDYVNRRIES